MKKKVLFIDRDGTLVIEPPVDYQLDSLEKLEFYPKVFRNLGFIRSKLDFEFVMVTNQDGLGTPSFPEETFWPAHNLMLKTLEGEGITFDEILIDDGLDVFIRERHIQTGIVLSRPRDKDVFPDVPGIDCGNRIEKGSVCAVHPLERLFPERPVGSVHDDAVNAVGQLDFFALSVFDDGESDIRVIELHERVLELRINLPAHGEQIFFRRRENVLLALDDRRQKIIVIRKIRIVPIRNQDGFF